MKSIILRQNFWLVPLVLIGFHLGQYEVNSLSSSSWSTIESKTFVKKGFAPLTVCHENDDMHKHILENQKEKQSILFYRDVNCICPYTESIWLALEHKNVMGHVITVLSESLDTVPRMEWPDGTIETDSMTILESIESKFGGNDDDTTDLYPKVSGSVDGVRANVVRFNGVPPTYSGVFPRHVDLQNKYAPFLYRRVDKTNVEDTNYEPVQLSNHMVSIEEADEMLEEYEDGPFFCGNVITAADLVWLPFMERYAVQLPLLTFPNVRKGFILNPKSTDSYPAIAEWFHAIQQQLPSYLCRICGDTRMWSQALQIGIDYQQQKATNKEDFVTLSTTMSTNSAAAPWKCPKHINVMNLWKQYAEDRPYVAETPVKECVSFLLQNREILKEQIQTDNANLNENDVDDALRELCNFLLQHENDEFFWGGPGLDDSVYNKLSGNARDALASIDQYILVPRDMGIIPSTVIRSLAKVSLRPRIK